MIQVKPIAIAIKVLIEADGNVNQARNNGCSPLLIASEEGKIDIVKVLIKAGGNINQAETTEGASPLFTSGSVAIGSGKSTGSASGSIEITSGIASGAQTSGDITMVVGVSSTGIGGAVSLSHIRNTQRNNCSGFDLCE